MHAKEMEFMQSYKFTRHALTIAFASKKNEMLENREYFLYENMGKHTIRYYLIVDFSVSL